MLPGQPDAGLAEPMREVCLFDGRRREELAHLRLEVDHSHAGEDLGDVGLDLGGVLIAVLGVTRHHFHQNRMQVIREGTYARANVRHPGLGDGAEQA